ncbi:MAG: isoleucyl-tRNA synthetase [Pseudomonadota bacterium]|jgi:isoleucyl-tRNA synthetase
MADKKASKGNAPSGTEGRDWGKTLFLPNTEFPMRANLPAREPELLARWQRLGLGDRLREAAKGRDKFTLHDGPPYANGNIHIGHALNKILKDLVVRSQSMLGYDSTYVPGWDCHGLPIEWQIEQQFRAKGRNKDDIPVNEFRKVCREFAGQWIDTQREEFKRLGVGGDWDNYYSTMAFHAEATIATELLKFAMNGLLYRGSKPVMWSVVEKTALAEAEVEYQDYQSDTIFVKFPIRGAGGDRGDGLTAAELVGNSIVIWTTTPWTIPGNRAISFSSKIKYSLYEVTAAPDGNWAKPGDKLILADNLAEVVMKAAKVESYENRGAVSGATLETVLCDHPLKGLAGGYDFTVPLLDGDHVTDDTGTGFVHTAPGHGSDDYSIWVASQLAGFAERNSQIERANTEISMTSSYFPAYPDDPSRPDYFRFDLQDQNYSIVTRIGYSNVPDKRERLNEIEKNIPFTVDAEGAFTKEAPGFEGKRVLKPNGDKGGANDAVIKALAEANALIARGRLKHQYPHSWRSKKPVIFRNTPQWFIAMDKALPSLGNNSLRQAAFAEIERVDWVPSAGRNRINGMIESKPDWVVSRQRAWGVPICVFVHKETGQIIPSDKFPDSDKLIARIQDAFAKKGADVWFEEGARERFLDGLVKTPSDWEQVRDILDVWFDSGSTHAFTLEDPKHFPSLAGIRRGIAGGNDRVMYLEGSDQHRGWFQSSLLESCGTRGHAPYDVVLTHGFVLDEKGQKMSKSLGNVTAPQDVIKNSGADILRLWVAASDYSDDLRIGPEILKTFVETYRKIRNTLRWMLGTLNHYEASFAVETSKLPELERVMLHRLAELDGDIRQAYERYDYKRVVSLLSQFLNTDLSAFYFDVRKDALYCEAYSSEKRRAALSTIEHIFRCVTLWLAPILVFTAEETWLSRYPSDDASVHLETFPEVSADWRDDALDSRWDRIRRVRRVVTGALEIERTNKTIGSSLEAAPIVHIQDAELRSLVEAVDFAEICITSGITITGEPAPADAFRLDEVAGVAVVPAKAEGRRCARSWRIVADVGTDPGYPDLSKRDAAAMREFDARSANK